MLEEETNVVPVAPNITGSKVVCKNRTVLNDLYPVQLGNQNFASKQNGTHWAGPKYNVDKSQPYVVSIGGSLPKECETARVENKTAEKILKDLKKKEEVEEYGDANVKAGIMFGSKALVQMLFNPFVGPITNR